MAQTFTVTHRSFMAIAVPMALAYISTPLLGLVDTAVIGQLDDPSLIGGLVLGSVIFDIVFMSFNFLRSGTTGLTAQAFGAGNKSELELVLIRSLILAIVAASLIVLLQYPVLSVGLNLLGGSDQVQSAAASYFSIRVLFSPLTLSNFAVLGWFLGLGMAKTGLLLQTLLNGTNIVLSALFVLHFEWGIQGVAYATALSELITLLVSLYFLYQRLGGIPRHPFASIFKRDDFLALLALNRDIMIRSFTLLGAFAFFTARSADQGDIVLAANAILEKFFLIAGYFLDGTATAAEQLVGRAIGARYRPAFKRSVNLSLLWGSLIALFLTVIFFLFGTHIVAVMSTHEEVRSAASQYLWWAALTPIAGTLAFQMDGIFIGATWSRDMRNMMLVSLALFLGLYYVFFPIMGNDGLWFALLVFLMLRGLTLTYRLRLRERQFFTAQHA
ncbi:MATE family efflux transporter [Flexibacterium corallicola]|uniref:MATE family efflux transporter n=1 Tax=Flexibacterium corallicola TaxID=3037259 RepID=UPI00286F5963|nr:MATE family efflux transporter [Pseudovibrio sp. M1P-2-3]